MVVRSAELDRLRLTMSYNNVGYALERQEVLKGEHFDFEIPLVANEQCLTLQPSALVDFPLFLTD